MPEERAFFDNQKVGGMAANVRFCRFQELVLIWGTKPKRDEQASCPFSQIVKGQKLKLQHFRWSGKRI